MASPRRKRLSLAVRRNQARTLLPEFREGIAAALKRPPEELALASLEETDTAWARLLERRRAIEDGTAWPDIMVTVRASGANEIRAGVGAIARHLIGRTMYLHRAASEVCGAVLVDADDLIAAIFDLVELDQEGVVAADAAADRALIVEQVTDPIGSGRPTFRLLAWSGFRVSRS